MVTRLHGQSSAVCVQTPNQFIENNIDLILELKLKSETEPNLCVFLTELQLHLIIV